MLPLSEKVKALYIIRKEKSPYADIPVIYLGILILNNPGFMSRLPEAMPHSFLVS